jgi:hypothetical protein
MRQSSAAQRKDQTETTRSATKEAAARAREEEKARRHVAGIKDRYFRDEQRKQEQAERQEQRTAARAEATRQRALAVATASRRKEIVKEISDRTTHENRLSDIARRASERRAEAERKHQTKMADLRRSLSQRGTDAAERDRARDASRASARAFDGELTARRRAYELDKKRTELAEKNSLTAGLGGAIRGAVIGGGVAAMAAGIGITGAAARDAMRLQEMANRISISARGAGEEAVDPNALRREFEQTAIATPGVKSADIAEAVAQFVSKTGNLDVARKSQGVFATVASATGSQVQDVAAAAADLFQKFDINSVEGMADAMAALAFQGKAGAFELKDAASQFAKLSAAASRFGLDKGANGVKVLGGLTQIARTATGSPEQAATAVEAMFRQFTAASSQKELKKLGVRVFSDKAGTRTRDIRDLIVDTISKSGGNLTKLQAIFGDEGIRAISPMISSFNEARKGAEAKGLAGKAATAAGEDALRNYIKTSIEAPGDYSELQKDAAQAQADASAKLTASWEKLQAGVGDKLIPVLTRMAEVLGNSDGAIDAFVGTVGTLSESFMGLVMVVNDAMEALGLATKKTKTPEQTAREEREKAHKFQQQINAIGSWSHVRELEKQGKFDEARRMRERLSQPGMEDKVAELTGKRDVALQYAREAEAKIATKSDQIQHVRTTEDFIKEYAAMAAPGKDPKTAEASARLVATTIRDQGLRSTFASNEGLLDGETEEQRQFRVNQAQGRREQLANRGVTREGQADKAQTGVADISAAAKVLADAIRGAASQIGPTPSIVGSP